MKSFFISILSLSSALLFGGDASTTIFSKDRLVRFYDEFLLEEKEYLAEAGLTSHSSFADTDAGKVAIDEFTPPPNPPAPPFISGYLPAVLVNQSGFPSSEVYVVITGNNAANTAQPVWGQIDTTTGIVTTVPVEIGQNALNYSVLLSSLPRGSTGRVIYLPQISGGNIWFSMQNPLNMPVNAGPAIQQPSPTNTTDPNYTTIWDRMEVAYIASGSPQISVDATAVSWFSMPLYLYLEGATSGGSNAGLYQPRSYIMSQLSSAFNAAYGSAEVNQWSKLLLTQGGNTLRCLSPGQSISASGFDENYLDDQATYGYSYISDLWSGASAYYKSGGNTLNMTVNVTEPSDATYTYTGQATGVGGTFAFTPTNGGPAVTLLAPTQGPPYASSTTYNILEGLNLVNPTNQPIAGTAADAVSKLFEEAIVTGILPLPTSTTLTLDYLVANQANYYKVNSLLSSPGGTTGPWYDLYSKALHALGIIYSFAYDDAIWPQVLVSGPFNNNSTYMGITIRNCTN